jgi:hypothetical protein
MQENASHVISLPLFKLNLPKRSLFEPQIKQLTEKSFALENRERRIKATKLVERTETASLFIEGLFQASRCHTPDAAVAISRSPKNYKKNSNNKISQHSFRDVVACFDALNDLGWINFHDGFVDLGDTSYPTVLWAAGELQEIFKPHQNYWQKLTTVFDPVVVRKKNSSGYQEDVETPEGDVTERIRSNLTLINDFISNQAICLNCPNWQLKQVALRVSKTNPLQIGGPRRHKTPLNFSQVILRRIFSQGRLDRGGRFYGGWWESIPKKFRRYITINGQPTVEVDFQEFHPRMLYVLHKLVPPQELYDLGLRFPKFPDYDPNTKPYKQQRDIIKKFMNALINDEQGKHRLSDANSKFLGLSDQELRSIVYKRHPVFKLAEKTDTGLHLQFLDSEIAEKVMLELMPQGIVALPVHDSFLVRQDFLPNLAAAMLKAFEDVMGATAKLKPEELPVDGFEYLINKRSDMVKLMDEHLGSFHRNYVLSWRKQNLEVSHPNLSFYTPWIPPL